MTLSLVFMVGYVLMWWGGLIAIVRFFVKRNLDWAGRIAMSVYIFITVIALFGGFK